MKADGRAVLMNRSDETCEGCLSMGTATEQLTVTQALSAASSLSSAGMASYLHM